MPDLPKAKYKVWARGYGLVDSPKVTASPASREHHGRAGADAAAAAQYYPAIYWYSMLNIPDAEPVRRQGRHLPANINQTDWLNMVKNNGCIGCHQLGQVSTRTILQPSASSTSSEKAWIQRVQSGQAGPLMINLLNAAGRASPLKYFGDWTDRIAKGELPHSEAHAAARRRTQHRRHPARLDATRSTISTT